MCLKGPKVCITSGKHKALYENIPVKEQLLGPLVRLNQKRQRDKEREYNPQLATVRIHKEKE